MFVWSYFWDSQSHLSNIAFWLELGGALLEVVVSAVIVATFKKEWSDEKLKGRLELLFEIGFLIAAIIALVAIVSNRRTETLIKREEQAKDKQYEKDCQRRNRMNTNLAV
jgi:hypothetical protein